MARWTENYQEVQHLSKIGEQMPIGGIAMIMLVDGRSIEGVLRRVNIGNNAGQGGWRYYGECEIETKEHQRWVIDYLDVKSAANLWSELKAAEYEKLGLIELVAI
jgi:hypothetical protein